ncbi:MAG: hypothetical protein PHN64_06175 [Desulfovibrionaceae bacterium]|nr:hypothetical protein [Desulfovibrionaceae bacterium]
MKKLILTLALVLGLAFSASAAVKDFGAYTLDVPEDWNTSQDGSTTAIIAKDNSAAISITLETTDGMSAADLAKAFSDQLKGTAPVKMADNAYSFTFKQNDVESKGMLQVEGDKYMLVVITGENPKVDTIMGSLKDKK